jgi:calcium-dependent protein kinase
MGSRTRGLKEYCGSPLKRSQFIANNSGERSIHDVYTIDKRKLGEGSYGYVCKGLHKETGATRAIKVMNKRKDEEKMRKEVRFLMDMDHPSIIKLYETYEDDQKIYLAMELCLGGELFDSIISAGQFSEVDAAVVMQQILRAVFYMHEKGVCHRDLKPENFLSCPRAPSGRTC